MISAAQKQYAKHICGKTLCINRRYTCHNLLKLLLRKLLLDHKPQKFLSKEFTGSTISANIQSVSAYGRVF